MAGRVPRVLGCRKTSYTLRSSSVNRSSHTGMALLLAVISHLSYTPSFAGLLYSSGYCIATMRFLLVSVLGIGKLLGVHCMEVRGMDPGRTTRGHRDGMARWPSSVSYGWRLRYWAWHCGPLSCRRRACRRFGALPRPGRAAQGRLWHGGMPSPG